MSLKGAQLRAHIEDLGYLVLIDPYQRANSRYVTTARGQQIARYDMAEDGAFRLGWVEYRDGKGRTDCLSWIEFVSELQEHKP